MIVFGITLQVFPTIISCIQRREERSRTLESLASQGIHPEVIESPCDPACRRENRRVGVEALSRAPLGAGVLFCEDDIRASRRLPYFLELAVEAGVTTAMCSMRDTCLSPATQAEIAAGQPMRPRIERANANIWYGTQCVYIPARVVKLVLEDPRRDKPKRGGRWDGFDFLLRDVLLTNSEPLYFALPNPVQHTAPPAVVAGKGPSKQSTTFHLKADRLMKEVTWQH